MAVRPPAQFKRPKLGDNPLAAALDQEILAEMAGTYGRLMRALEAALAALRAFDEGCKEVAGEEGNRAQRGKADWPPGDSPPPRSREGGARTGVSALETDAQRGKADWPPGDSPPPRSREGAARTGVSASDSRAELVRKAGEALWHVVIQRDVMRLTNTKQFLKELQVPAEVVLAMGVSKRV